MMAKSKKLANEMISAITPMTINDKIRIILFTSY